MLTHAINFLFTYLHKIKYQRIPGIVVYDSCVKFNEFIAQSLKIAFHFYKK